MSWQSLWFLIPKGIFLYPDGEMRHFRIHLYKVFGTRLSAKPMGAKSELEGLKNKGKDELSFEMFRILEL
jgi:hypothetical protein